MPSYPSRELPRPAFGREDEMSLRLTVADEGDTAPEPHQIAVALVRMAEGLFPAKHTKRKAAQSGVFLPWCKLYETNAYVETASQIAATPASLYGLIRRSQQVVGFLAREYSRESDGRYTLAAFNSVSNRHGRVAKQSGMHMNYLVSNVLFDRMRLRRKWKKGLTYEQRAWSSWLALASLLVGAGKVGGDGKNKRKGFQLTERADFVAKGADALLHERDEPHADPKRFGRLHVINREGNRSYWSICFDTAISAVMLQALEAGALDLPWHIVRPNVALKRISNDIDFTRSVRIVTRAGRAANEKPLVLLAELLALLAEFAGTLPYRWGSYFIEEAREVVAHLDQGDWRGLPSTMIDWAIKRKFLERSMARRRYEWDDPHIRLLDLFYHRLDDEAVLCAAAEVCRVRDFEIHHMPFGDPSSDEFRASSGPRETRAYLMELCIRDSHLARSMRIVEWDTLEFIEEEDKWMKVLTLSDPLAFNAAHIKRMLRGDLDFSTRARRLRLLYALQKEGNDARSRSSHERDLHIRASKGLAVMEREIAREVAPNE